MDIELYGLEAGSGFAPGPDLTDNLVEDFVDSLNAAGKHSPHPVAQTPPLARPAHAWPAESVRFMAPDGRLVPYQHQAGDPAGWTSH